MTLDSVPEDVKYFHRKARCWDVAVGLGKALKAAPALERVIRENLRKGDAEAVLFNLQELRGNAPSYRPDLDTIVKLAAFLARESPREAGKLIPVGMQRLEALTPVGQVLHLMRAAAASLSPLAPELARRALAGCHY